MGGPSQQTQQLEQTNIAQQNQLAQQELSQIAVPQEQRAEQLFNLTYPGLQTAESFYQSIASGDPSKIFKSIAPAVEQMTAQTQGAKQQIMANTPRGGVQQLGLEQANIQQAGQVGQLATQAYTSSFPALASLAGQGIGLSTNQIANAISAYGGASSAFRGAGQMAGELGQQQAEGKATTMGFIGSLAGAAGEGAAAACWVAEVLYGINDVRTHLLRAWLNGEFKRTWYGRIIMRLYVKYGQQIAEQLKQRAWLQWLLRPLFDLALVRASKGIIYASA